MFDPLIPAVIVFNLNRKLFNYFSGIISFVLLLYLCHIFPVTGYNYRNEITSPRSLLDNILNKVDIIASIIDKITRVINTIIKVIQIINEVIYLIQSICKLPLLTPVQQLTTENSVGVPDYHVHPDQPLVIQCNHEGDKLSNPTDCGSYYLCKQNEPVLRYCEPGSYWNCAYQRCGENKIISCCPKDFKNKYYCYNGVKYPDYQDDTKYKVCVNGILIHKKCPEDYTFNFDTLECDDDDDDLDILDLLL